MTQACKIRLLLKKEEPAEAQKTVRTWTELLSHLIGNNEFTVCPPKPCRAYGQDMEEVRIEMSATGYYKVIGSDLVAER